MILKASICFLTTFVAIARGAGCPYLAGNGRASRMALDKGAPRDAVHRNARLSHRRLESQASQASSTEAFYEALSQLKYADIKADLVNLMHTPQDFWPPDNNHYGPLFIRLAWHCAGTYRTFDGRGGCDGATQRFDPERSWDDNANLDKARTLLEPIKLKYGVGLSWGDLIQLAGYAAIEDMGIKLSGFCAGRIDAADGRDTSYNPIAPELICVNPAGPGGNPSPKDLVPDIRGIFTIMGMNDSETVALLGGHSWGKAHGACPDGSGPSPAEDEYNPWPGNCGIGKGADAYTSGFEGQWTSKPLLWDNEFYKNLLTYDWVNITGPGGKPQWKPVNKTDPTNTNLPNIMMLTSDVALLYDELYFNITVLFSKDRRSLDDTFRQAWYKLTTHDMGPYVRCRQLNGLKLPPPQPWQYNLPAPPASLPNFGQVKTSIKAILREENADVLPMDPWGYGPLFVRLAWQCVNTYRATDYLGGCNGARIRLSPQTTWPENADLDKAINLLEPIHEQYKSQNLSWGDLIVLAGNAALEDAAAGANVAISIPFVGGRVDAPTDEIPYPDYVDMPLEGGNSQNDTSDAMKDAFVAMGLTNREAVALVAAGHSLGSMHRNRSQFADGSWTTTPGVLNTEFLENLLTLKWEIMNEGTDMIEYQAQKSNMTLYMLRTDINIAVDDEYEAIAQEYLISPEVFYEEFVNAWAKITSADMMFYSVTTDGQDSSDDVPSDSGETGLSQQAIWVITVLVSSVVGGIVIASLAYLYMVKVKGYHFTDKAAFEPLLNDYN